MRTISVLNQKGGVGKTTTVANVSAALAGCGQRVLVIDLDPQAHLTIHLGVDAEQKDCGIYKVLSGSARLDEAMVYVRPNMWLLSAGIELVGAEAELVNEVGREIILRQALEPMKDHFDYVLIDCPPSLGLLTLNALATSTEVVIPIQPHFLALQGFSRLLQTVSLVQSRINPALRVSAILMCMFDARTSLSVEVRQDIEKFLSGSRNQNSPWAGAAIIPVHVRRNIKLAEAPSYGKTIFEYEPTCHGATDYLSVAEFIHTGKIEGAFEIKKLQENIEPAPAAEESAAVQETVEQTSPQPAAEQTPVSTETGLQGSIEPSLQEPAVPQE